MKEKYWIYLVVMALTTYAVRALPFTAFAGKIKSRFFRSFLYYVPYAVLTAMTIPAILYSTGSIASAGIGLAIAVILSIMEKDLMTVALFSCIGVYIAEWLI